MERALDDQDLKKALEFLGAALQIQPTSAELLVASGFISFQLQDFDTAQRQFKRAVDCHPEHIPAHVNLAVTLITTGRTPEAEVALRRALFRFPKDEELVEQLAKLLIHGERFQEAASLYGEILAETPNNISALVGVAECFCHLGDLDTARIACEDALRIDPGNQKAKGIYEMLTTPAAEA